MKSDIKISYLNIISRHRYFNDVKCELNLNSSDVVILSEKKKLKCNRKSTDYKMSGFDGP